MEKIGALILAIFFGLVSLSYAQSGTFLGNLNSNPYDPNSLSNPYGAGNPYSPDSPTPVSGVKSR